MRRRDTRDGARYRVLVHEVWGSAQSRDEEHGRKTVMVTDQPSVSAALREVVHHARAANFSVAYLTSAVSQAECDAEDWEEEAIAA